MMLDNEVRQLVSVNIWQCEIISNVKSFMKMTTYVGGKFTFAGVYSVKSAVKTVIKSAVTSVAKFDLNLKPSL